MMKAHRWGDNDKYLGPFTYSRDIGWRPIAVVLGSGDDESPGCCLRLMAFGHTLIVALPPIIRPPREYGFTLSDGHLSVAFGRQTHDSTTEQRWGCFLPWTQWRHVRRSFYGLDGEHVATLPDAGKSYLGGLDRWVRERAIADATPTVAFDFLDYDGEHIVAVTKVEEREWRFGEGWFRWLSLFRRPRVVRSLDLVFSKETGNRKGSWKGGTIGHAIDMLPGELHEAAFRRYCGEHNMKFLSAQEEGAS